MNEKRRIKMLERKIHNQKDRLTQLQQIADERDFLLSSKKKEALSDMYELYNNLQDDLEMDKTGESGYSTHKESYQAVKKYTWKLLKRKIKKWKKLSLSTPKKEELNNSSKKDCYDCADYPDCKIANGISNHSICKNFKKRSPS